MRRAPVALPAAAPVALLVVATLAAWWPALGWLARTWAVHPYYAHGPLVVLAAGAFLWLRRDRLIAGAPSAYGLALVAAGAGLHVLAATRQVWPLSVAALLLALGGVAALIGGGGALRAAAYPLGIAALAIPLPLAERIAPWLAANAAAASAALAGAFGADVQRAGAMLVVGGGAMTVGAPCSGLNSLVALITLAAVLAGVVGGPPGRRAALVAAAVPLALFANGLRLTSLLWLADAFGAAFGMAFFHGPASPTAFLVATAGLLGVARLLGCRVVPA
jgi:exosortase